MAGEKKRLLKSQVIEWLQEEFDFWSGKFIDAEEADNDDGMQKAEEKTDKFDEMIDFLKNY